MALNSQQEIAVKKTDGACVILAGAGTGKSFTVIEKVNYLVHVEKKYKPEEILCLTFSNEATNSLNRKLQEKLNTASNVLVKTFHSFCADILREDGHLIKIDEGFEILLPDDAKILMHKYLNIAPYWANRYISTIQNAKDFGITLDELKTYFEKVKTGLEEELPNGVQTEDEISEYEEKQRIKLQTLHLMPSGTVDERKEIREEKKTIQGFLSAYDEYLKFKEFIEAWDGYDSLKKEHNYLDFSDLNLLVIQLFNQFGADKYVDQFKYVFVDEFQDTNKLQFALIEFIAKHGNITVVGDPNQSIYGFRGAYKESFDHYIFRIPWALAQVVVGESCPP
ncbi:UvrD-helicase domain-containing protein [Candidatus Woesearchaeota archaeon]|nr:UvrD-helicase domain-containing protein [Candidatus Woesearchaeota archaeon]